MQKKLIAFTATKATYQNDAHLKSLAKQADRLADAVVTLSNQHNDFADIKAHLDQLEKIALNNGLDNSTWWVGIKALASLIDKTIDPEVKGEVLERLIKIYSQFKQGETYVDGSALAQIKKAEQEIIKDILFHVAPTIYHSGARELFVRLYGETMGYPALDTFSRQEVLSFIHQYGSQDSPLKAQGLLFLTIKKYASDKEFVNAILQDKNIAADLRLYAYSLNIYEHKANIIPNYISKLALNYMKELGEDNHDINQLIASPTAAYTIKAMLMAILAFNRQELDLKSSHLHQHGDRLYEGFLNRGYDNGNNAYEIGTRLFASNSYKELLFILAHELGHNILLFDYGIKTTETNTQERAVHEFTADLLGMLLLKKMGWNVADIWKTLRLNDEYITLMHTGGQTQNAYTAARGQFVSITMALESFPEPDQTKYLEKLLHNILDIMELKPSSAHNFHALVEAAALDKKETAPRTEIRMSIVPHSEINPQNLLH